MPAQTDACAAEQPTTIPDARHRCAHLRNNQYYLGREPVPSALPEGTEVPSWCFVTFQMIAPDGGGVSVHRCVAGRACFVAPEDEPEALAALANAYNDHEYAGAEVAAVEADGTTVEADGTNARNENPSRHDEHPAASAAHPAASAEHPAASAEHPVASAEHTNAP